MSSSPSDSEAQRLPPIANGSTNPVPSSNEQAFAITRPVREIGADDPASQLVRVLDQCLADLQAGKPIDRERLLAEHPDLAAPLNDCLAGIEFIHRAAPANSATPTQLGDFRIVREVGRGGMGVVYEAEQISLKRRVALKVLRFGAASDIEAMQRFQREAETVATLHHTNIVPIFAIGCEQGVNYYAMQFIEGRSLADTLHRLPGEPVGVSLRTISATDEVRGLTPSGSPSRINDNANWGLQAAEALAHAHQRGVIHRDIKPSNLILDPDGRIWLTDFGLAKRMDDVSLSIAGTVLGTPRYMSPEQASATKNPVDHRTDIYSLGATLYELATGRPLFEADSPHAVITQILTTEPPAPRVVCPSLPRDFETIIVKCLAKEPGRRYATAQALADDLRAFVEGRAIKARRATLAEQAARWFKQQKRSVGIAAATVAATIFVVIGSLLAWQMHSQAQLGYLTLESPREDALRAEVADVRTLDDEPVGSPFTLPTKEPLALPAGAYRLRLNAPSKLSRDYLFDIAAGQQMKFNVGLANETVGYALPLKSPAGVEVASFNRNASGVRAEGQPSTPTPLALGLNEPRLFVGPQDSKQPTMRAFAANAQLGWNPDGTRQTEIAPLFSAVWRLEAPGIASFLKLPAGKEAWKVLQVQTDVIAWQQVWEWFKPNWWRNGTPPQVMQPLRDLNGDGVEDVIWSAPQTMLPQIQNAAVLLAVSGKDGQPLWWFRTQDSKGVACWLVTTPVWAGDAIVSVVRSVNDSDSRIEAVSPTTGESLWRHDAGAVGSAWLTTATIDGRASVIAIIQDRLFVLDAATGERRMGTPARLVWDEHGKVGVQDLDEGGTGKSAHPTAVSLANVRFADLDGDGTPEALLSVFVEDRRVDVIALSLVRREALWQVASSVKVEPPHDQPQGSQPWPFVVDLDGDDRPEIVLPNHRGRQLTFWTGCRVHNGATGELRWERRFPIRRVGGNSYLRPDQYSLGPDLDGDGQRELIVASIRSEFGPRQVGQIAAHHYEEYFLYVDAFSGRDGRSLWWQRVPLGLTEYAAMTGTIGEMLWWGGRGARFHRASLDGHVENVPHESLVIPIHRHPDTQADGGTHSIFVLNAATGRIEHQADDLAFPQLVDWNNDGLDDLAVFVPDDPVRFELRNSYPDTPTGKFVVLRGSPPEAFRRLDRWTEEQDFDGDGIAELSRPIGGMGIDYAVQIASGRDGRIMSRWKTEWPETPRSHTVGELHSFAPPLGDFDGDGLADLLLTRDSHFYDFEPKSLVTTGKVPLLVQAISGKTGKRVWGGPSMPLPEAFRPTAAEENSEPWLTMRVNRVAPMWAQSLDIDRDGRPEVLQIQHLIGQRRAESSGGPTVEQQQRFLSLIDGRDGSLRWAEPFTELLSGSGYWHNSGAQAQVDASADLNADGTCDVVLVVPQQDAQGWWSGTLQARNGRDGKLLWPAQPIDGKWVDSRGLKPPLIGDLDGDGRPEIVLFETIQPQFRVVRGDTGETLWTWKATQNLSPYSSQPEVALVAHAARVRPPEDDNGAREPRAPHHVAVTINETGNQWELVLLDHAGQVVERVPYQSNQIWSHDLDGDGGEELLRFVDNQLTASRGLHDVLWSWSPPPFGYVHLSRFDRGPDGRAIVVTSSGDSLTLLDGPTGKPLGRTFKSANASLSENNRNVDLNHAVITTPFENSRLLTRVGDGHPMLDHVVSRAVLPTEADGRYARRMGTLARPDTEATAEVERRTGKSAHPTTRFGNDPRLVRRLMWAPTPGEWAAQCGQILQQLLLAVGLSFVIVLIPYWLIRAGIRRRELGWWRGAMIFAGATLILASLALFRLAPPSAKWRDVPGLLRFVMAVGGLPVLLYPAAIFGALAAGNWQRVRWLLIATLALTAILAAIQMGVDLSQKPPEQHYSWFGWWMIFAMGAYFTGGCLVLGHICGPGVRWFRGRLFRQSRG